MEPGEDKKSIEELRAHWESADFERDDARAGALADQIWSPTGSAAGALKLNVIGTNFQLKVWQALLDLGARGERHDLFRSRAPHRRRG